MRAGKGAKPVVGLEALLGHEAKKGEARVTTVHEKTSASAHKSQVVVGKAMQTHWTWGSEECPRRRGRGPVR